MLRHQVMVEYLNATKKSAISEEDVEEIKRSVNLNSEEGGNISRQQELILNLMGQIKNLQKQDSEKAPENTGATGHHQSGQQQNKQAEY